MPNQELSDFIKKSREAGQGDDEIRQELKNVGWQEQDIEEGFKSIEAQSVSPVPPIQAISPSVPAQSNEPVKPQNYSDLLYGTSKPSSAAATPAGNSSKKLITVIVIILILLAGGTAAYYFINNSVVEKQIEDPPKITDNTQQQEQQQPVSLLRTEEKKTTETPASQPASVPHPPQSSQPVVEQNNSAYDTLIKTLTAAGWKKASYFPDKYSYGLPFIFYYPPNMETQNTNYEISVGEWIGANGGKAWSEVAQFSSNGGFSFDEMAKISSIFVKGEKVTSDFSIPIGLTGKKITGSGEEKEYIKILLHTDRQSDVKKEILIEIFGFFGYHGNGNGYTGNSEIIEQMAKTINFE